MDFYHIYNRGVESRDIFIDQTDLNRFNYSLKVFNTKNPIQSIYHLNLIKNKDLAVGPLNSSLVDLVAYSLNPNHFHLLVGSEERQNVSEFTKRVVGGYTSYFNNRYQRNGVLFQGKTKKKIITGDGSLEYVASYIIANHYVHGIGRGSLTTNSFKNQIKDQFNFNTGLFYDQAKKLAQNINKGREDLRGVELEDVNLKFSGRTAKS